MAERKLIYADELDAALESAQKTLETNWEKQWKMNKGQVKGLAWARAILREAKSADVAAILPKWISVEERMPETQTTVMLAVKRDGGGIRIAIGYRAHWTPARYYVDGGNCAVDANRITHWMPLPEPPEVNEK